MKKRPAFLDFKQIFLAITLLCAYSCQKEAVVTEELLSMATEKSTGGIQIKTISYAQLQGELSKEHLGLLNVHLKKNQPSKRLSIQNDMVLITDSLKKITVPGHTSYTIPLAQKRGQKATFQNLMINVTPKGAQVFLFTYRPYKRWAKEFKKKRKEPFHGTVSIVKLDEKLNIKAKGTEIKDELFCVDIYYYRSVDCSAQQSAKGNYTSVVVTPKCYSLTRDQFCTWSGGGGSTGGGSTGGGGGGSGTYNPPTYPDMPPDYNPDCGTNGNSISIINPDCPEEMVPTLAFEIEIHKMLTKNAAAKLGFCASAIDLLTQGVADTDYKTYFGLTPGTSFLHFDGFQNYNAIKQNWDGLTSSINTQTAANNFYKLGCLSHAFQDFYAHSNYAELLIKFYGDDLHIIPFSDVLNDNSGQHNSLKAYLQNELKTGSFDLATWAFGEWGASVQNINYETTHSYINKDNANTYAGAYAARLAEKQTRDILIKVQKKCQ